MFVEHLAGDNLKVRSGVAGCRDRTYPPSKPTTASSHELAVDVSARALADFCRRISTFIVRLRTVLPVVWADNGKSSPRKSAALSKGSRAAILAVRYLISSVIGFLSVNIIE